MILFGVIACLIGQGCSWGVKIAPDELQESAYAAVFDTKPDLAWQSKLPSPPSALLPLGANVLLAPTYRGELYSLNLITGDREGQMQQPLRKPITAQLVHSEGPFIYIASSQDEELRAYNLARGRIQWKRRASGITGQLGVAQGLLLAASLGGEVSAYDITDGRLVWHKRLPGRIYQGVLVMDDRAIVLNDSGNLYALPIRNPADMSQSEGSEADIPNEDYPHLWERQLPVNPNAVVGSGGGQLVIGDSDGRLLVVDPASGTIVFQTQLAAPIYSRPLIAGVLVVAATAAGEIVALQSNDGSPVWQAEGAGLVRLPLMVMNGWTPRAVLVPFARGQLLALELTTGRELWRYDMENPLEQVSLTSGGIVIADRLRQLFFLQCVDSTTRPPN